MNYVEKNGTTGLPGPGEAVAEAMDRTLAAVSIASLAGGGGYDGLIGYFTETDDDDYVSTVDDGFCTCCFGDIGCDDHYCKHCGAKMAER